MEIITDQLWHFIFHYRLHLGLFGSSNVLNTNSTALLPERVRKIFLVISITLLPCLDILFCVQSPYSQFPPYHLTIG